MTGELVGWSGDALRCPQLRGCRGRHLATWPICDAYDEANQAALSFPATPISLAFFALHLGLAIWVNSPWLVATLIPP